ncbi:helix-turn-helix transcriptional regulator [Streptomyces sp. NPDC088812]|uniref:helix-turn-helix transcriptional regulator n=1 Tax=Streptomyces sp. NPDC088812 TaxID=3365905 RepID=UPI003807D14B
MITIGQIAEEHGVSRSSVHTYRRSATFPQPVPAEGSTRIRYRADEVAAWFEANPPQQGRRTDLASQDEGAPVPTTEQSQSDAAEAIWSLADRLANVLAYQVGLAVQQVGLSEEQGEELARAVVRTVHEVAAEWESADGDR